MLDNYGRNIIYLRISVTDKCNLRCRYCMPEEGIAKQKHSSILSLEEITRIVEIASRTGIRKVRLTGGEPLVRKNIAHLVASIADIPGIDDLAITTNGTLFGDMAARLKEAGLKRVNFSLDTLVEEKFSFITRGGKLNDAYKPIFKALDMGFNPVKLNVVVIKGFNDDEILDFAKLAYDYPLHVRFIELMPVGDLLFWNKERILSIQEIINSIQKRYPLVPARKIEGNGPAKYYGLEGGQGSLGFISPMSNHFCSECNRIRLTADGKLRGCLYSSKEINLKKAIASGVTDDELQNLITQAILAKPARHRMGTGWGEENKRKMYQIGG